MPGEIPVLYEDAQVVVFDKPAGVLVIAAPGKTKNILADQVNAGTCQGAQARLHPCHRLDQMTSGAIIFARGKGNQQKVMGLFQKGEVEKTYIAFVKGRLKRPCGEIRAPVKDRYQDVYAKGSRGKPAVTEYRVIDCLRGLSVVEVRPRTGRTNQIRIHFARIGHPLLGERVYAFRRDFEIDMKRLALHCHELRFRNPVSGAEIRAVSVLPKDMSDFLNMVSGEKRPKEQGGC